MNSRTLRSICRALSDGPGEDLQSVTHVADANGVGSKDHYVVITHDRQNHSPWRVRRVYVTDDGLPVYNDTDQPVEIGGGRYCDTGKRAWAIAKTEIEEAARYNTLDGRCPGCDVIVENAGAIPYCEPCRDRYNPEYGMTEREIDQYIAATGGNEPAPPHQLDA